MKLLEITQPYVIELEQFTDTVDLSDTEIRATRPMPCAVVIRPRHDQALEGKISIGIVNPAWQANDGLVVWGVSDCIIDVRAVRGALKNGVVIDQRGEYGTFNNFVTINSIRHNGGNGLLMQSPRADHLGVQGNHIKIGQIIFCDHSGIAVFGSESAWNTFQVGPVEHNKMYGIYEEGELGARSAMTPPRLNKWHVVDSNQNGLSDHYEGYVLP